MSNIDDIYDSTLSVEARASALSTVASKAATEAAKLEVQGDADAARRMSAYADAKREARLKAAAASREATLKAEEEVAKIDRQAARN